MSAACPCGWPSAAPFTAEEIRALAALRGRAVVICKLCGHEIPIQRAHDLRKLASVGGRLVHRACARHHGLLRRKMSS